MKISLDTPFTVGDLAPDASYPHVYIITFYVNGPAMMASISYEIGTLTPDVSSPLGATWEKAPEVSARSVQIQGKELIPFFVTQGEEGASVWDQVERLLYAEIQGHDERLAGTVE